MIDESNVEILFTLALILTSSAVGALLCGFFFARSFEKALLHVVDEYEKKLEEK
jgi:hypothetical protein